MKQIQHKNKNIKKEVKKKSEEPKKSKPYVNAWGNVIGDDDDRELEGYSTYSTRR